MMRVLLVRPRPSDLTDETDRDAEALRDIGCDVVTDPYLEVRPCSDAGVQDRIQVLVQALAPGAWFVATSSMGPRSLGALAGDEVRAAVLAAGQGVRAAAVGPTTAAAVRDLGFTDVLVPDRATGAALAEELVRRPPARAVLAQGNRALPVVAERLRAAGWEVVTAVVYATENVAREPVTAADVRAGGFDLVVLRSPSAARALHAFTEGQGRAGVVCTGPTTAAEALRLGLDVRAETDDSTAAAVARAVASLMEG
jgi:uroporphyrinogen-III synthase